MNFLLSHTESHAVCEEYFRADPKAKGASSRGNGMVISSKMLEPDPQGSFMSLDPFGAMTKVNLELGSTRNRSLFGSLVKKRFDE